MRFSGKTVIVTGAGSGFGRATAVRFAADVDQDTVNATVGSIRDNVGTATALTGDIAASILFLAGDEAAFLTGVCLDVDGGKEYSLRLRKSPPRELRRSVLPQKSLWFPIQMTLVCAIDKRHRAYELLRASTCPRVLSTHCKPLTKPTLSNLVA